MAFIRTAIAFTLVLFQFHAGQAQGTRKTMLAQLAALKGYIITAEKGYQIAKEGVHLIRNIKSAEFFLHQVFFQSLRKVDDGVWQNPELNESLQLIEAIDKAFARAISAYEAAGWLQTEEVQYIRGLQQRTSVQNRDDHKELEALTTDGTLSMTDGERIGRIKEVFTSLQERYNQTKNFLAGVAWLIDQRQKEQMYTETLKKWYGIQ